ncbi:hypothetical protein BP6252_04477 [Coleophoma cylindrospora]|uniref:Major facilitator superfamily (MFS) profile domain-containing protein n=1 Tax=Coleophoma cylindrospora TaxID=1849047 RepID=A0A3D8S0L8_9HELO|nr:hypothetical protein BP6252_04477 [Coleophoma cylindrospora]
MSSSNPTSDCHVVVDGDAISLIILPPAVHPSPQGELTIHSSLEARNHGIESASGSSSVRSRIQLTATLLALFLSLFLAALDFTIATTATPTIIDELHSATAYTWIGSAYLLASAASTPVLAKFSDIFGRKNILLAAVAIFFVGSAICASSNTTTSFIAGRSVQGSGAGGMIILTNICISDLFSMRDRGLFLGLTGVVWSLASGAGPLLGGALTEYVSWRWNWWINLPISGFAFGVLYFSLHVHNPRTSFLQGAKAIDWLGTVLILGLTLMILLGLSLGGIISPWGSPKVVCLIVFGLVIVFVFGIHETRFATNPLMPMRIVQRRSNVASLLVCFMHGFVNMSSWYFLPLYFQAVKEASPLRSGLLILPITVVQAVVSVAAGCFIRYTGRYLELIWIGMAGTCLGFGLFIKLGVNSSLVEIVLFQIVAGVGVGLVFQPPLIALQSLVAQEDVAAATALFGFSRSFSTAVSAVIGGVIFQNQMQAHYNELLFILPGDVARNFSGQAAAANVKLIATLTGAEKMAVQKSYAESLSTMWILYSSIAGLGLVLSVFITKQNLATEHVETRTGVRKDGQGKAPEAVVTA